MKPPSRMLRRVTAALAVACAAVVAPMALAAPALAGDERITVSGKTTRDTLAGRWVTIWTAHNNTSQTAKISEHVGREWSSATIAPRGDAHYRDLVPGTEKVAYGGVTVLWPGSSTEITYRAQRKLTGGCTVDVLPPFAGG